MKRIAIIPVDPRVTDIWTDECVGQDPWEAGHYRVDDQLARDLDAVTRFLADLENMQSEVGQALSIIAPKTEARRLRAAAGLEES